MFKVGDVVCLKSGGPAMTVTSVNNQDGVSGLIAQVMWFKNNGDLCASAIVAEVLVLSGAEASFVPEETQAEGDIYPFRFEAPAAEVAEPVTADKAVDHAAADEDATVRYNRAEQRHREALENYRGSAHV